jgi:drug/metabolite transporter (DMT)-like permease
MSRATSLGFVSLFTWSLLALLGAAVHRLPPFETLALTFAIGSLVGVILARWRGTPLSAMWRQPPAAWAIGVTGIFGYHACYFFALTVAPPAQVTLVTYLWPLLLVLLARRRPTGRQIAGAAVALVGAWAAVVDRGVGGISAAALPGLAAALACALIWAGYSAAQRWFADVPPEALAGTCAVIAVLAAACHLGIEVTVVPSGGEWLAVVALGVGPVGVAFFAWDHAMKHGDARALGVAANAVPVVSTGLLVICGITAATAGLAIACALVAGGVAIARAARPAEAR